MQIIKKLSNIFLSTIFEALTHDLRGEVDDIQEKVWEIKGILSERDKSTKGCFFHLNSRLDRIERNLKASLSVNNQKDA